MGRIYLRTFSLIILLLTLTACAMITYDRTNAQGSSVLVDKYYAIQKDSFLLSDTCIYSSSDQCLFIQVAGGRVSISHWGGITMTSLPDTLTEYDNNKALYGNQLHDTGWIGLHERNIVGYIPAGTKIRVTKLISLARGDNGRCWVVHGQLLTLFSHYDIEIPSCYIPPYDYPQGNPVWFQNKCGLRMTCPPKPDPQYLISY